MKLWQVKSSRSQVADLIQNFTVGDDFIIDSHFLPYDLAASLAHAKMLFKMKLITPKELHNIKRGLNEIKKQWLQGKFAVKKSDEDMHTAIENYLTEKYGSAGEKIHTGRSRNDQILVAVWLFLKQELRATLKEMGALQKILGIFIRQCGNAPMPGYSHQQRGMPITVGIWAAAFAESLKDDKTIVKAAVQVIDQSPLGSGAGFGVPIKLDRELTAKLLKFQRVQKNPLYCQNSRGKFENIALQAIGNVMLTLNKLAVDILLFTTKEFNFFSVPESLTTGSSIMPQKRNLDVAEILRGKTKLFFGYQQQIQSLFLDLMSGYNRDLQLTKKPLIEAFNTAKESIRAAILLMSKIKPNKKMLKKACEGDILAAKKVYKLVEKGIPFRQAYKKVKKSLTKT